MTESEARARKFYDRLGAGGLAARTRDDWDAAIVARLGAMIPRGARVLDAGCGYGRIAVPLARAGGDVIGLDIARGLLAEARRRARTAGVQLALVEASLLDLPLRAGSVDVALSLWSAFYELTTEPEQVRALAELRRVLRAGGWALLEGPAFDTPDAERDGRVALVSVEGLPCHTYRHDAGSLSALARRAGIAHHELAIDDWAGRPRQLFRFRVP